MRGVVAALSLALIAALCLLMVVTLRSTIFPPTTKFETIEIRGSTRFYSQVTKALLLLRTKSPRAFATVTNNIGRIEEAKKSGMAAYETPPTFELADPSAFYSVTWCAIAIAHDSLHSKMYHDYLREHPGQRVPDLIWTGEQAEKQCCDYELGVAIEIGAPPYEIQWAKWDPKNRYWEVPESKADW
ncbi:MAG: hypothetical protein C5B50_06200 [Verrucomicrobia bacterium]|nr:MAG: hypothetical protein C5B50_06200 [Verrucomicrobiota bacterium]